MNAGRELDALIAEKVMGFETVNFKSSDPHEIIVTKDAEGNMRMAVPFYSTDIAAAWEVVEKLRDTWAIELHGRDGAWSCLVEEGDEVTAHFIAIAEADTAPLAICLAALKVVEK